MILRPCIHRIGIGMAAILGGYLLLPGPVLAQDGYRATGARFLTIGGGARALAMGETYLVESSDPFVQFYNPAPLSGEGPVKVGLAHNAHFQNAHGEYAAMMIPAGRVGLGLALQMFAVNNIPRRVGPTEQPLGEFDAVDAQVVGSAGCAISPKVRLGLAMKGVFQKIDTEVANGIAFDVGGLYQVTGRIAVGAALDNLGPEMSFKQATYKLPSTFRLGGGYTTDQWALRGELVSPRNEASKFHFGGEYVFRLPTAQSPASVTDARLALRAGYTFGYDTRSWAVGFGAGVRYVEIDYAFVPYKDDLGDTHHFGVVFTLQ